MVSPAAGLPEAVSRTCVVRRPIVTFVFSAAAAAAVFAPRGSMPFAEAMRNPKQDNGLCRKPDQTPLLGNGCPDFRQFSWGKAPLRDEQRRPGRPAALEGTMGLRGLPQWKRLPDFDLHR